MRHIAFKLKVESDVVSVRGLRCHQWEIHQSACFTHGWTVSSDKKIVSSVYIKSTDCPQMNQHVWGFSCIMKKRETIQIHVMFPRNEKCRAGRETCKLQCTYSTSTHTQHFNLPHPQSRFSKPSVRTCVTRSVGNPNSNFQPSHRHPCLFQTTASK